MGMAPDRYRGCGDSQTVAGSMLCAGVTRCNDAVGMAGAKKEEAVLWIGRRAVAKTDFSLKARTSHWRVVGQSWETAQPVAISKETR